mgnify:CR=1 FL=1
MINQLRHEACTGSIDDLAHVISEDCLADCLTKASANPKALIQAVNTGTLPNVDKHPPFRELMQYKHKAYSTELLSDDSDEEDEQPDALVAWIVHSLERADEVAYFMDIPVRQRIEKYLSLACDDWWLQ